MSTIPATIMPPRPVPNPAIRPSTLGTKIRAATADIFLDITSTVKSPMVAKPRRASIFSSQLQRNRLAHTQLNCIAVEVMVPVTSESSPCVGNRNPPYGGSGSTSGHLWTDYERVTTSAAPAHNGTDAPRIPSLGAADLTRSLTRQSLLVAGVCLFADALQLLFAAPVSTMVPQTWAVLVAVALADAALALPARFAGWVAAAHAVVQIVAAVLTLGSEAASGVGTAGFLIAGYRAGAWLSGAPAWAALAMLVCSTVGVSLISGGSGHLMLVDMASNALLPWLVGRYTTARRGYIAELEHQADRQRREARAAVDLAVRELSLIHI